MDLLVAVYFLVIVCVMYACFAGAGVAHSHGETEDEERGGSAGSGTRLRPCSGGLRNTQFKCICYLLLHM